jgi:hypothetical protein
MKIQTLYKPHPSHRGVLAIRAERISENIIRVDDPVEVRCLPNNIDVLAEAGYYTDPAQTKNHEE